MPPKKKQAPLGWTPAERKTMERLAGIQETLDKLYSSSFPKQREFIDAPERFIVGFCSRRAGKTIASAIRLIKQCLVHPRSRCLYVALTRNTARKLMFEALEELNRKHNLGMIFRRNLLEVLFENGSHIDLLGMDTPGQAEKCLGQRFSEVIIDEAASFRTSLDDLVNNVLLPTLGDMNGNLVFIGSPQHLTRNLFARITKGEEPGWTIYRWTWKDNPYVKKGMQTLLDRELAKNPDYKTTALYAHTYAGEWFTDNDHLVYHLNIEKNIVEGDVFEEYVRDKKTYVFFCGLDIGWHDATSFTILAVNPYDRRIVVILSVKKAAKTATQIGEFLNDLNDRFNFARIWGDTGGSGKVAIEDLRARFDLNIEAAEKHDKLTHISFLNDDLAAKNIVLLAEHTEPLIEEMQTLIWDRRLLSNQGKYRELESMDNHCCDSLLYAHRAAKHYFALPADQAPQKIVGLDAEMRQKVIEHARQTREDRFKAWYDNSTPGENDWLFDPIN